MRKLAYKTGEVIGFIIALVLLIGILALISSLIYLGIAFLLGL